MMKGRLTGERKKKQIPLEEKVYNEQMSGDRHTHKLLKCSDNLNDKHSQENYRFPE